MSKITKKLFDDYKATKKVVKKAKFAHQQNVDKIKEIILPYVDENYKHTNHEISGIDFCYDNDYKIKDLPVEYEWIKISEKEYDNLYYYNTNKYSNFKTEIKIEEIYEPDYEELYYKKGKKRYEYLRVYVHEWWAYGGNDNVTYDFLLSEIMDEQYLRKEKLLKLRKLEETV